MTVVVEGPPGRVQEHPLLPDDAAARADSLMQTVADGLKRAIRGPNTDDGVQSSWTLKDKQGRVVEDFSFMYIQGELSQLSINQPGRYSLLVIPRQPEFRVRQAAVIDYMPVAGQSFYTSEESHVVVQKILSERFG